MNERACDLPFRKIEKTCPPEVARKQNVTPGINPNKAARTNHIAIEDGAHLTSAVSLGR